MCIDPLSIERMIGPNTEAILGVHVYGMPCAVEEIEYIAAKYKLKVIYDGAHAFMTSINGVPISDFGDITMFSFHATKLFHTIEGGGIITNDDELAHKISYMRNFGHNGPEAFYGVGVNGKSSEFQAAMGLCLIPKIDHIIETRKSLSDFYTSSLAGIPIQHLNIQPGTTKYNFAYYPIVFNTEVELLKVVKALNEKQIMPRRYFYPSLNILHYVANNLENDYATDVSKRVLCLPLYPDLEMEQVRIISDCIRSQIC
jgi:dTDP-4-amino-4,6-dideoxygalactose transaminase